jgi:glycosyltransferase involved in cell wall biosynthesis
MEAGARELVAELERRGVTVTEYPYPAPARYRHTLVKGLSYGLGLPLLCLRLLWGASRFDLLHLAILYRHFIYSEVFLIACVRARGTPVVLHVRPGDWWLQYRKRSRIYRALFTAAVRLSRTVVVESPDLLERMRSLGAEPVYLPSFVTDAPRLRTEAPTRRSPISLVYVGAVNDSKGVPTVLAALRALRNQGFVVSLAVVGAGAPDYFAALAATYDEPEICWMGPVPHRSVRAIVRCAHFFLFPTTFVGEGHSNALNECMAEGVVPIVSDHGANRHVVVGSGVVLPVGASPQDYAGAVAGIWNAGDWSERSNRCVEIVKTRFYAPVVIPTLLSAYAAAVAAGGRRRRVKSSSRGADR